jgi:hypothetical protein
VRGLPFGAFKVRFSSIRFWLGVSGFLLWCSNRATFWCGGMLRLCSAARLFCFPEWSHGNTIAFVSAFLFREEGGVDYDGQKFISMSFVLKILTPCNTLRELSNQFDGNNLIKMIRELSFEPFLCPTFANGLFDWEEQSTSSYANGMLLDCLAQSVWWRRSGRNGTASTEHPSKHAIPAIPRDAKAESRSFPQNFSANVVSQLECIGRSCIFLFTVVFGRGG